MLPPASVLGVAEDFEEITFVHGESRFLLALDRDLNSLLAIDVRDPATTRVAARHDFTDLEVRDVTPVGRSRTVAVASESGTASFVVATNSSTGLLTLIRVSDAALPSMAGTIDVGLGADVDQTDLLMR